MKNLCRFGFDSGSEDRRGMILIIAMLIMAIMSIIGAAAMNTSRIDIQISHNTEVARQAFYFADSGLEMSPKIIRKAIDDGSMAAVPNVVIDGGLFNEIMGYATETDSVTAAVPTADLQLVMGKTSLMADIDRTGTGFMAGSGVEFASGAEGAGAGTTGGVLIFYTLDSIGAAPRQARSNIDAYYRYVVGVAGGK